MTSEGEIASRPIEPLRSSGNKVCKKQAKKSVRKLGLFCIDCGEIDGSHKINMDAFVSYTKIVLPKPTTKSVEHEDET